MLPRRCMNGSPGHRFFASNAAAQNRTPNTHTKVPILPITHERLSCPMRNAKAAPIRQTSNPITYIFISPPFHILRILWQGSVVSCPIFSHNHNQIRIGGMNGGIPLPCQWSICGHIRISLFPFPLILRKIASIKFRDELIECPRFLLEKTALHHISANTIKILSRGKTFFHRVINL